MSRLFGPLMQLGYVVNDLESAMAFWAERLGIGPWFYLPHLSVPDFTYRGRPSAVDLSLGLANSGAMQIELIQQHNDAPSMYQDFRARYSGEIVPAPDAPEGVQHLGYGTWDFAVTLAKAISAGYSIVQQGTGGSRGPFAYLDTEGHPGTVIEIIDLAHGRGHLFHEIVHAADIWDGSEPIRTKLPV